MFDNNFADNFADIFRGGLPYCLLLALPVLIICSANPVLAASEFPVYRMTQFDVNGVAYGCRASALSLEAKSLYSWSTNRHCVVAKFSDISISDWSEIRQKAGGLVLLLPKNVEALNVEEKEHLTLLEQTILAQSIPVPVYFSAYNTELESIISDITRTTKADAVKNNSSKVQRGGSALSDIFSTISANGYQITVTGASHSANKNSKISIIQGELAPNQFIVKQVETSAEANVNLPTIVIATHLKTFGIYNEYPLNSDAAVLLSFIELFSKLHNVPGAAPKYRIMFLLSETGLLLNFQGIKKWLDENVVVQNVDFVLCLDTLTQGLNYMDSNSLYMHVSKPPKEGSSMNNFFKILKSVALKVSQNLTVEGVHKKINLAEPQLAWEHERFSMKRFPAFTLSSVKSPKQPIRTTIFKDKESRQLQEIQIYAKIIAESLAKYVYKIDDSDSLFDGTMDINKNLIRSYLNVKSPLLNNDLKDCFEKYLKNVKIIYDKPDVREPDFMLYDGLDAKLNIYKVKPAVFDLFLTIVISAYLAIIYFVVQHFGKFYDYVCKLTKVQSCSVQNNGNHHNERNKSKLN